MTAYVLRLSDIDRGHIEDAGGKGANLGELTRVPGVRVSDGFVVTTPAYADVVGGSEEVAGLLEQLSRLSMGADDQLQVLSRRIREAIESLPIPADITEAIGACLDELGAEHAYAVRSSATAEDLPTASFAGQQDTYLNVIGRDAVIDQVRKCWASLFTERAVAYRLEQGIDHAGVRLAVVVQRMVFADAAGIMFTADPITSNRKATSIDAGFGLGEALVSGLVTADNYTVEDRAITGRRVAAQTAVVESTLGGGVQQIEIEPELQRVQKLSDARILELADIGKRVEAHFGTPQDVEWALAGGELYILQARPITTLFPVPGPDDGKLHVYLSFGHQQMMTDAMRPLGLSFFQAQFDQTPLVEAGGRFFMDLTPDLASPLTRRLMVTMMGRADPLMGSGLWSLLRRPGFAADLARGGVRFLKLGGSGYLSWRMLWETVRHYRSNDPTRVLALRAEHDAILRDLSHHLASLSEDELFDGIAEALRSELATVTSPQIMGAVYVGVFSLARLNKLLARWLGVKGAGDLLAQGVSDDVTSQLGLALLDVADAVREHPAVLAALPTLTDDSFFADLSRLEGGAEVGRVLEEFLAAYGVRCTGEIDITRPRWNEQPSQLVPVILSNIQASGPQARDARVRQGRLEAERAERDLLERLARQPHGRAKVRKARASISRLQNFVGHREYPKYLMMRYYWIIKQALLAEAARLVDRGVIERPDDVYYLTLDEFRDAVRTGQADAELIRRRRAEFASWEKLTPPRVITSDGEVPAAGYGNDRIPTGALPGIAASAGVVEGRARIVPSLADAHLEQGDILVTAFTDPSWTPVFLTVTGVVTEVGGSMTHGAVVAREYGLPAVVGVESATRLIADGQRIRVNGTEGYVELL